MFDSGIGGLTVVTRIQQLLPHENILYLGDTARVPYGTKSEETIRKFTLQSADFLVQAGVKCLVLACNTASAHALPYVREKYPNVPIYGMIETGAAYAVSHGFKHVALIGTSATVKSKAYANEIAMRDASIHVFEKACPLFVPLVEEGLVDGVLCHETIRHYLQDVNEQKIEALILGCTHYPLLRQAIQDFLPQVILIDSGEAAALALADEFALKKMLNTQDKFGFLHCYLTSPTDKFRDMARQCLTRDLDEIHFIDLD